MSNNDGAAVAQYMAVGEELSRAMVELEHLREENERLRAALKDISNPDWWGGDTRRNDLANRMIRRSRAALGEEK